MFVERHSLKIMGAVTLLAAGLVVFFVGPLALVGLPWWDDGRGGEDWSTEHEAVWWITRVLGVVWGLAVIAWSVPWVAPEDRGPFVACPSCGHEVGTEPCRCSECGTWVGEGEAASVMGLRLRRFECWVRGWCAAGSVGVLFVSAVTFVCPLPWTTSISLWEFLEERDVHGRLPVGVMAKARFDRVSWQRITSPDPRAIQRLGIPAAGQLEFRRRESDGRHEPVDAEGEMPVVWDGRRLVSRAAAESRLALDEAAVVPRMASAVGIDAADPAYPMLEEALDALLDDLLVRTAAGGGESVELWMPGKEDTRRSEVLMTARVRDVHPLAWYILVVAGACVAVGVRWVRA